MADRVGIGWRPEIGPSILCNLDSIDVVEVILDDYLNLSKKELRPLLTLAAQVPVIYHGVGLGLASSWPIDTSRLVKLARALDCLSPQVWSEHLAFVRAGGYEIGHLAAPPRTLMTVAGTLANLEQIQKVVGSRPVLENIATLIDPPGSKLSEPEWVSLILAGAGDGLLLDLHNLYANAVNFGIDPFDYLKAFPLQHTRLVHLSGGHWIDEPSLADSGIRGKRLLDDHVHDVPLIVFELLERLAEEAIEPMTVIIERDGAYPAFPDLLNQIKRARQAILTGREHAFAQKGAGLERTNF